MFEVTSRNILSSRILLNIPIELRPGLSNKNWEHYIYILNRFNILNLPTNFIMNTRGGWVTPSGSFYIPSITANTDDVLRPLLKDSFKYKNNLRLQAFQEGWVRIDWQQPSFDRKFTTNPQGVRKIIITLDKNILMSYKLFLAIQHIVMFYSIALPEGITYELRLISKYEDNKLVIESKTFKGFEFFNLSLINQRK